MSVKEHIARIREVNVGINDWLDAYKSIAVAYELGKKSAAFERIAFAETVAQAMFADIQLDEVYCVGGAYPTGIVLDKREMESYVDVLAAIQLLREVIVQLQSDSDEPVGLGFWIDEDNPNECWIDASNLLTDKEAAIKLMKQRGELAIWDTYNQMEIRASVRVLSEKEKREGDRRFSEWKRRTLHRR